MAGAHGVKETKEGLLAIAVLGKFVTERLKDGVDLSDATAVIQKLLQDGDFKDKVLAGIQGAEAIPAEVMEIDLADALELAKVLPELIEIASA